MKELLKLGIFLILSISFIYYIVGVETIIKNAEDILLYGFVLFLFLGLLMEAEEKRKKEAKENNKKFDEFLGGKFFYFVFFIISFWASVILVVIFSDEILNKKTFLVFNFDNTARYVSINDKQYVLKPHSHKVIITRGANVEVDYHSVRANGRYLVNISKNKCYRIEPIIFLSKFKTASVIDVGNPYVNIITDRILYYNNDKYLVFKNEKFKYLKKDESKYNVIIPASCKEKIYY